MPRDSAPIVYGAGEAAWAQWDVVLGLTDDLLPVVSNPHARISERSSLKALGKTPSLYNRQGEAVGIKGWTDKISSGSEVERWSQVADYGVCLQTRRVRAIDIDVPDAEASAAIVEAVQVALGGVQLPRRYRAGTGKCLLLFELAGEYGKRVVPVAGGMVELLMTGQQCVVAGRHSDGSRYEWAGGLPDDIPVLSAEAFEALYAGLVTAFATGSPTEVRRVASGADLGLDDEIASWLVENWETFGADREGRRLFVTCPWKGEHSFDSGETEAAWLMRGVGGFERGHFNCQHSHCKGRGRDSFLLAVKYEMAGFDVIETGQTNGGATENPGRGELELPLPGFSRKDNGVIKAVLNNLIRACQYKEACGCELAYDTFRDELLISHRDIWRPLRDVDAIRIRSKLEGKNFDPIPKELMRDAIRDVAEANSFDAAIRWLEGLAPWDGIERCGRFMADYMGALPGDYASAVGLYAWTAHAGRVMDPGCKADMVISLMGPQGQRKSAAIAAIAPLPEFATELSLHKIDNDLARKMRGVLVAEIAELRGLNSTDAESIRAWITQRQEKWTHKFVEHATIFLRRLVLWSTTNEDEFLADPTGERRWLPIEIERDCDDKAVARDREQLWAEGLARWRENGIAWQDAERLAKGEHGRFKVQDPWADRIAHWLDDEDMAGGMQRDGDGFKLETVAINVLGLDFARFGKREEQRIGKILRNEGLSRVLKRLDGKPQRVWVTLRS